MTHPPKILERTNEGGVSRTERDRLIEDVEDYLIATCANDRAKRITVTVVVKVKGESDA